MNPDHFVVNFNPVLLDLGLIQIRWYALAYIAGVLAGWAVLTRWLLPASLQVRGAQDWQRPHIAQLINWIIIGIIIGGRLGHVVFYYPQYYAHNPLEILMVWQGGMAFHGGLIGAGCALLCFARRHQKPFWPLADLLVCVAPIGITLGRIANFINGELWGRPFQGPWAMIFPRADAQPRHPSQLYEAALEGLLLWVVLWSLCRWLPSVMRAPGLLSGLFLVLYAVARMTGEFFRAEEVLGVYGLTWGQALCLPLLALGAVLLFNATRSGAKATPKP